MLDDKYKQETHRPEWAWDLSDEEWAAWLRWRRAARAALSAREGR